MKDIIHMRHGTEILYTHSIWEVVDHSRSKMHETCLIIIHDPGIELGPESNQGPLDKQMSVLPLS